MSTKLRVGGQSQAEIYAVIRNSDDEIWNGTSFVTFNASNQEDYDIELTEQGTSGYYSVDFPSTIDAGTYHINYHQRIVSGVTDLVTPDDVFYQEVKVWDGAQIVASLVNQSSVTDICNMALGHLGVTTEIDNYETDTTEEAIVCRRYFETARDKTLREFPWQFASQFADLGLVSENPTEEWEYSYRYPSDCLMIRRILSGSRNDSRQSRVSYRLARDSAGLLIYSDMEDAQVEYTLRDDNPSFYPPDFILAMSYLLAFMIAPKLSAGDQFRLGERAVQLYNVEIRRAWANSRNEVQPDEEVEAESIRAREG